MCQIYSFASFLNAKKKIYIEFALYKRLRVLYNSFRWGALAQLVECHTGSVDVSGSSPLCSTIHEKSELIPNRERVRIFYFHQRYYRLSVGSRFCLAQNRGLCTFDEAFLLLYNSSINQKGDCIWKFSTLALETTIFKTWHCRKNPAPHINVWQAASFHRVRIVGKAVLT